MKQRINNEIRHINSFMFVCCKNSMKEGEAHRQVRVTSPQILRGNALTQGLKRIYSVLPKIAFSMLAHPDKVARSQIVGAANNAVTRNGAHSTVSTHSNSLNSALDKIAYVISLFLFPLPTVLKDGEDQLAVPLTSPQYSPQMKGSFNVLTERDFNRHLKLSMASLHGSSWGSDFVERFWNIIGIEWLIVGVLAKGQSVVAPFVTKLGIAIGVNEQRNVPLLSFFQGQFQLLSRADTHRFQSAKREIVFVGNSVTKKYQPMFLDFERVGCVPGRVSALTNGLCCGRKGIMIGICRRKFIGSCAKDANQSTRYFCLQQLHTSNFIAGLFACERVIIHSHSLRLLFCNSIVRDGGADTQRYSAPSLTMRVNALLGLVRGFQPTSFGTGSWQDEVAA